MDIREHIRTLLRDGLQAAGVEGTEIQLEHPTDISHGDYATNVALAAASDTGESPRDLAERIVDALDPEEHDEIEDITVAGPGFINIRLSRNFFASQIDTIHSEKEAFGVGDTYAGKRVMVEYTDPNPFKVPHIGHLMSNVIGESLSRIVEAHGAEVKRACYQGDVGMHVAKAIWAIQHIFIQGGRPLPKDRPLREQVEYLNDAYAVGARAYADEDSDRLPDSLSKERIQEDIREINKQIYDKSDDEVNEIYQWGREVSLQYFETIYEILGTSFDHYFFESESGVRGKEFVEDHIGDIFEESEGAVIFPGEDYDLHTRVFINAAGLPTYEAKELGLAKIKHEKYPYDHSVIVTGNEVNDYFRVLLKAMEFVFPELAEKTEHIGHGMMRLPEGKMSSRTGEIIAAEDLIDAAHKKIIKKMEESERVVDLSEEDRFDIAQQVAVAAIKYSVLKQHIGRDVVFDMNQALSFEGDSGPYLQYTTVRARSVVAKAKEAGITSSFKSVQDDLSETERLLYRFPEVVEAAWRERAPHHITQYITDVASTFNSYYGSVQIIADEPGAPYRVAVAEATAQVLENGLRLLGIAVPEQM